jgi:mono/diheme cytochrome c family protein
VLAACLGATSLRLPVHAQQTPQTPASDAAAARGTIEQYCVGCHNQQVRAGEFTLDTRLDQIRPGRLGDDAGVWETAIRKLRTGVMPPQGAPHPDALSIARVIAFLETELDRTSEAAPDPGSPVLHRLNRTEYANAVRDLLDLDVEVTALLPPDDSAYGFDNVSDVLGVSPVLQERYLAAAERISELAVGAPSSPVTDTYRVRQDVSQNQHLEGLPLGTLGGLQVRHTFPLDAEYAFGVTLYRTNFDNPKGIEHPHEVEITVDGFRVHSAVIGGPTDLAAAFERPSETADAIDARLSTRLRLSAGPHTIAVAFVEHQAALNATRLRPFTRSAHDTLDWTGRPHIRALAVTGPFAPSGPGDTPSRRRIFSCVPTNGVAASACASQILSRLARLAYRREPSDADLQQLLTFYREHEREGGFERGIQAALQLVLANPTFLFRAEPVPPGVAPGSPYRLSDTELASRLAFFLWSSLPDAELLDAAAAGQLSSGTSLERQVRRMLADPRSRALVDNFAGQWLQLRNVRNVLPNSDLFPDFDDNLRQAFTRETELLFESVIREDRSVLDLLTADFTFVNGRLAAHYGIPGVYGSRFRRVAVTDEARKGLLGHGSILALTSHAERTSPVLRGKWILDNLLGTPPPPPPPNVDTTLEPSAPDGQPRTLREQMLEHRANPVCASCHKVMDPLGLALENFDAVGRWRTRETGGPIDASGVLADGTAVDGVASLRQALVRQPEIFVGALTEKLFVYALGRGVGHTDMPAVRAVVRRAAQEDFRLSSLILGIAQSVPFTMRTAPDN